MTTILLATLALTAPPAESPQAAASASSYVQKAAPAPQTRAAWVAEVTAALREQALGKDEDQPRAVVKLISLYQQLAEDKTLRNTERARLRLKLRSRLVRLATEIPADLQHRKTKVEVVERRAKAEKRPEKLKLIEQDKAVLAQWDNMLAQIGGFGGGAGVGGGGGGGALDRGEELVELIEKVITPDFWDVNGGPGSIVYFQGLRVLVISATDEVHHNIGGLMGGIRRAGN